MATQNIFRSPSELVHVHHPKIDGIIRVWQKNAFISINNYRQFTVCGGLTELENYHWNFIINMRT